MHTQIPTGLGSTHDLPSHFTDSSRTSHSNRFVRHLHARSTRLLQGVEVPQVYIRFLELRAMIHKFCDSNGTLLVLELDIIPGS